MKKETFYFLLAAMAVAAGLLIALAPAGAQQVKAALPKSTQEWTTASQFTFAWDVPTLADGAPVPAGDTIKYQPYLKPDGGAATAYGDEIAATSVTATLTAEGRYRGCVRAVRYPAGSSERIASEISCSDVATVCKDGAAWGVIYYIMIASPTGLRKLP